jgi:hypothetical protein
MAAAALFTASSGLALGVGTAGAEVQSERKTATLTFMAGSEQIVCLLDGNSSLDTGTSVATVTQLTSRLTAEGEYVDDPRCRGYQTTTVTYRDAAGGMQQVKGITYASTYAESEVTGVAGDLTTSHQVTFTECDTRVSGSCTMLFQTSPAPAPK